MDNEILSKLLEDLQSDTPTLNGGSYSTTYESELEDSLSEIGTGNKQVNDYINAPSTSKETAQTLTKYALAQGMPPTLLAYTAGRALAEADAGFKALNVEAISSRLRKENQQALANERQLEINENIKAMNEITKVNEGDKNRDVSYARIASTERIARAKLALARFSLNKKRNKATSPYIHNKTNTDGKNKVENLPGNAKKDDDKQFNYDYTKQNKTKQNKTKQNKTKQNKTKQNKTKQNLND